MDCRTTSKKSTILSHLICLSIYTFTALSLSAPASLAQQSPAASSNTSASTELRRYNIPAQPLSEALIEFGKQSGLQVTTGSVLVEGKQAPSVSGTFSAEQALNQLLAGNNLRYEVNGGMVRLAAGTETTALPSVRIGAQDLLGTANSAYRVESATISILGEKTLKDTPYSIESYSRELMNNKQARSLADITKGDASIDLTPDALAHENNALSVRGIPIDRYNGQKIDGLITRLTAVDFPLEHLERVEILKGAAGFLYGYASPSGTINYVLKRPTDRHFRSLSTQVMDSGLALIHGDVGGRLGADSRFGYRINLVHESGDTYIDGNSLIDEDGTSRRSSGSITLDWQVTPDLVWRFDAMAGKHIRNGSLSGLLANSDGTPYNFTVSKPPAPIDGSRRLAPSFMGYRSGIKTYGTDISWNFAADWTLNLAYRYSENIRGNLGAPWILVNSSGNYSLRTFLGGNLFENSQSQGFISGAFTTGIISHELAVGASYSESVHSFANPNPFPVFSFNASNLSNPVDIVNPFNPFNLNFNLLDEYRVERWSEIFVSDTLHLGQNWDIIIGLRNSNLDMKYAGYDKSAFTPAIATIFRPLDGLSLYGSYIEALEQGATAPRTAANADEVFPPIISKQYEFGAKAEGDNWSATAALFLLQNGLTYTNPDNVFTQDGEARFQGLELNGKFRLSSRWLLIASAMWLDATNQKTTDGTLDGKRMQAAAREQIRLYGEYQAPGIPLTLTAGARYQGKRPVDPGNQFYIDDVTLFDIGARYGMSIAGRRLTLHLNVDNLTDKAYWLLAGTRFSRLFQGMPRTIKFGARLEF